MKKLVLYVLLLSTLLCQGCIYLPIIYSSSPKGSIDYSFITIGVTTKEDIVLRCGKPEYVMGDEKILVYQWATVVGMGFGGAGSGGGGLMEVITNLRIELDENGIVTSHKVDRQLSDRGKWF